jgi:glutaredoxin 2
VKAPDPFLEVRVKQLDTKPSIIGLCVGYELGNWRTAQFAEHLMNWLPEFVLTHAEIEGLHSGNMLELLRQAAKKVYASKKFRSRGEFGELLLHVAIRQVFESLPAISKIFYKSARNDTVKGFDAVHVVPTPEGLELWLG